MNNQVWIAKKKYYEKVFPENKKIILGRHGML